MFYRYRIGEIRLEGEKVNLPSNLIVRVESLPVWWRRRIEIQESFALTSGCRSALSTPDLFCYVAKEQT